MTKVEMKQQPGTPETQTGTEKNAERNPETAAEKKAGLDPETGTEKDACSAGTGTEKAAETDPDPGTENAAEKMTAAEKKAPAAENDPENEPSAAGSDPSGSETGAADAEAANGIAETAETENASKKGLFGKKKKAEDTVPKSVYDELNNQYLRLNADFQNFRRRNENARSEAYADAKAGLITELLGVLDNFDRALANPTEDTKYAEGVELIYKTFDEILKKAGLTEIEAAGKVFDPNLHNAVMRQPAEGVESDTIINVFQKGYMLNGKVLRPSMVVVAE